MSSVTQVLENTGNEKNELFEAMKERHKKSESELRKELKTAKRKVAYVEVTYPYRLCFTPKNKIL